MPALLLTAVARVAAYLHERLGPPRVGGRERAHGALCATKRPHDVCRMVAHNQQAQAHPARCDAERDEWPRCLAPWWLPSAHGAHGSSMNPTLGGAPSHGRPRHFWVDRLRQPGENREGAMGDTLEGVVLQGVCIGTPVDRPSCVSYCARPFLFQWAHAAQARPL